MKCINFVGHINLSNKDDKRGKITFQRNHHESYRR